MNFYLDKTRLIVSTIALSIVMLFVACDRHKYSKDDIVTIIDISEPIAEKYAKKGIKISEEERKKIIETVYREGLLDD